MDIVQIVVIAVIIVLVFLAIGSERQDQHCFYNSGLNIKSCPEHIISPEPGDTKEDLFVKLNKGIRHDDFNVVWRRSLIVAFIVVLIIAIVFHYINILPFSLGPYLILLIIIFFGIYGLQNYQRNHQEFPISLELEKTVKAVENICS